MRLMNVRVEMLLSLASSVQEELGYVCDGGRQMSVPPGLLERPSHSDQRREASLASRVDLPLVMTA